MKKIVLLFLLIMILFWFFKPEKVFGWDYWDELCALYGICPPQPCETSCDSPNPGTCAKGGKLGGNVCPSDCGPNSADCCDRIDPWEKWKATCVKTGILSCNWAWQFDTKICSTGDKCVSGDKGLRPGYCDCNRDPTQMYKTCCDDDGHAVDCTLYAVQDGVGYPEGVCRAGSSEVRCSGNVCGTDEACEAKDGGGEDRDDNGDGCLGVCCTAGTCVDPDPGPPSGITCGGRWVAGGENDIDCIQETGKCGARCCGSCEFTDDGDEHSAAWLEAKVFRLSGVTDTYEVPEDDCGDGTTVTVNVSPGDQIGFTVGGWIRDMNSSGEPAGPKEGKSGAKVRAFVYFGDTNLKWDDKDTYGLLYHAPRVGGTPEQFRGDANAPIEILWYSNYHGVRMHDPGEDSSEFHARVALLYSECDFPLSPGHSYPDCVDRDFEECQRCCDYGEHGNDCGSTCEGSGYSSKCYTGETSENKGNHLTLCSLKYGDSNDSYDSKDYFELGWDGVAFLEIRGEGAGQQFCVEGKFGPEKADVEDTGKICFQIGPSTTTPTPTLTPTPRPPTPTPTPLRGPVCTF